MSKVRTNNFLLSETELLGQIAQGNEQSFKTIYDTYFTKTYQFAFHVLHSKELAEEVVQEVMLWLWQSGNEITKIRNIESFLKTFARRRAIDTLRRTAIEKKWKLDLQSDWREEGEGLEQKIILGETRKILQEGIQMLPHQQRTVYQLCHQQELTYEQVAEQLKISKGTVQKHMSLALKFLRAYLRQHADLAVLLIIFRLI